MWWRRCLTGYSADMSETWLSVVTALITSISVAITAGFTYFRLRHRYEAREHEIRRMYAIASDLAEGRDIAASDRNKLIHLLENPELSPRDERLRLAAERQRLLRDTERDEADADEWWVVGRPTEEDHGDGQG